jgi:hypothetical protein
LDYIDCGNNASLQLSTCTINFWLKINSAVTGSVISKYGAWYLGLIDSVLVLYDWDGVGWIDTATDLNDNTWHMITFIRQAGVAGGSSIYIDNVLISTFTYDSDTHDNNFIIGGTSTGVIFEDGDITFEDGDVTFEDSPEVTGGVFDGAIDNVMIFNRVLTTDEIFYLYNSEAGRELVIIIEVTGHPFETDDVIYLEDITGIAGLNGNYYTVTKIDDNHFSFEGIGGIYGVYESGGTVGFYDCERDYRACAKRENLSRYGGFFGLLTGGVKIAY